MTTVTQILTKAKAYLGVTTGSATHKAIIDKYNGVKPLPVGYKVSYTDDWCDAFISALAIETGAVDIIGRECGVQRHIDIFKQKGIWFEDGRITPKPGDIITFNWDDYTQTNDGFADHIGIVESVANGQITTIEGNTDRAVKRRTYRVGNGFIRGYARPKYAAATSTTPSTQKSVTDLAHEVIAGKHGTGDARKKALGSQYSAVQAKVNELLKSTAKKKTNAQVAREIYRGQGGWGNGTTRINKLKSAGYDPVVIQNLVNKMFK